MIAVRPLVQAGHVAERGDPQVAPPSQHLEPLGDQGPVEASKRHHVADRTQRNQIEPLHEVRLRAGRAVPAGRAQRPVERDRQEEGHADRGQITELLGVGRHRGLVQAVRIDHGRRPGQLRRGRVVVHDNNVEPGLGRRRQGLEGGYAAVHGHYHGHPLGLQRQERVGIGPISLLDPVGHIDMRLGPGGAQKAGQQGGRGRPVHVVVAEDGDRLAAHDRAGQARRPGVHVLEPRGVGQGLAQARIEEGLGLVEADAARGQHPADDLRQPQALGQGERQAGIAQALLPAFAADRVLDAQETGPRLGAG